MPHLVMNTCVQKVRPVRDSLFIVLSELTETGTSSHFWNAELSCSHFSEGVRPKSKVKELCSMSRKSGAWFSLLFWRATAASFDRRLGRMMDESGTE
jgi:hypothetical protein